MHQCSSFEIQRQASNRISCLQASYLHFNEHVGLHEAGCGHEEGGVGDSARSGDDLPATAMDRLVGDHRIQYFELAIPDWLFAKRALSRSCEREDGYIMNISTRQIPCSLKLFGQRLYSRRGLEFRKQIVARAASRHKIKTK